MFTILVWLVFGWIAGSIAEALCPPTSSTGRWQTIATGVAGSVVGGIVGSAIAGNHYRPAGIVSSVIGAVVLILLTRHLKGNE